MSENDRQNLIAYARVSTDDQAEKGTHKTQHMQFDEYAADNNINILKVFTDAGSHGWTLERPEFQEMLLMLKSPKVDGLLIQHQDRFSRADPFDTVALIRSIMNTDKQIISIIEGKLGKQTLEQQLLIMITSYTSAKRIEVDKEKQKAGIRRYKAEKGRWGRKEIKFDKKKYLELRELGITKADCRKFFHMSSSTLYRRLKKLGIDDFGEFKTKKKVETNE